MSWTAVRAIQIDATGSVGVAYTNGRVRGIYSHTSVTQGIIAVLDGATTILSYVQTSSSNHYMLLPTAGVRFTTGCSVTGPAASNITVFFD